MFGLFRGPRRQVVGIDIGTSALKVAEIGRTDNRRELLNYGEARTREYLSTLRDALTGVESGGPLQNQTTRTFEEGLADLLKRLLTEAGVKTKVAVFSLPVFTSFSTTISFPATMKEEELTGAIPFEAKSYVPLPLTEVELDWMVLPPRPGEGAGLREVFIVAVPKETIEKYQRIASRAGLESLAFEVETFSLTRAVAAAGEHVLIADIGTTATSLSIVAEGVLRLSHSVEVAGNEFSRVLAQGLRVSRERAEAFKKEEGVAAATASGVRNVLAPFIDQLVGEILRVLEIYERKATKKVERLILCGGSSRLPGIVEYIGAKTRRTCVLGQALAALEYPKELEPIMPELNAVFSVAVGSALRELT